MKDGEFYVLLNNKETGPFTLAQLSRMLAMQQITRDTLYAQPGMENWLPISDLKPPMADDSTRTPAEGTSIRLSMPAHEGMWAQALREVFLERGIQATVEVVPTNKTIPKASPSLDLKQPLLEAAQRAMTALRNGDLEAPQRIITEFESRTKLSQGVIDWSEALEDSSLAQVLWLLRSSCADLSNEELTRSKVGACLAVSSLLGETVVEAIQRVRATTGELQCSALAGFIKRDPQGVASQVFGDLEVAEITGVYVQTKLAEAASRVTLNQFRRSKSCKGVEVLSDRNCRMCTKARRRFRWSDLGTTQPLPRHWGCTCTYLPWL